MAPDGMIRPRVDTDLDVVVALATVVQELDGYPVWLPGGDVLEFMVNPPSQAAWVAEIDGRIVGHIALNRATTPESMQVAAQATGRSVEEMGVIARLLVAPEVRRQGIGGALVDVCVAAAVEQGLQPMLDVGLRHGSGVAMYDATGWDRVGKVDAVLPNGEIFEEYVYVLRV